MKKLALFLAVASTLAVSMSANADTAYQQGNITTSDRGAYQYVGQALADDFVSLASGALINATWTGSYYGAVNNTGHESFTFNLYAAGSAPGALLFSQVGTASFVNSATGGSYKDYSLNLTGASLTAGVAYWVSIYSNDSPQNYAWANSSDGSSNGAFANNVSSNTVNWASLNGDGRANHVFALNVTAVPEPETYAMLLAGLGLMGGIARRRKQK